MVKPTNTREHMFKFSTKLHVFKNRVKKSGQSSLYLQVYISNTGSWDRDYFKLNLEWPFDKIDFDNAMLLPRHKGDPDVNDYNMIIMSERGKYNEIAKRYRLSNRSLSIENLKRELFYYDPTYSVIGYFKKRRNELWRDKQIVESTWKNYGSTITDLEDFNPKLRWDQVNAKFMVAFKAFLKKKKKSNGENLAFNTIWTKMKDLKSFFAVAQDEVNVSVPADVISFPNPYQETESTYLNKEKIVRLIQQMDPDVLTPTHYNVLKAFLFCCFTGIRISDLYNSTYSWMISNNFMKFTMKKNSEKKPKTITIPLIPLAKVLIGRSDGQFFQLPTQQEFNRSLKDLAKFAGIDKKITSHVARHTFGYLTMKYVGDIYLLKKLLGHSKLETTENYAHIEDEDNFDKTIMIQGEFIDIYKIRKMIG